MIQTQGRVSKRKQLLDALAARCSRVTRANNMETDVGQRVYWGRVTYVGQEPQRSPIADEENYPYTRIDIVNGNFDQRLGSGKNQLPKMTVRVDVSGYVEAVDDEPDKTEAILWDLEAGLEINTSLAREAQVANVGKILYTGNDVETRDQGRKIAIVTLNLELVIGICLGVDF